MGNEDPHRSTLRGAGSRGRRGTDSLDSATVAGAARHGRPPHPTLVPLARAASLSLLPQRVAGGVTGALGALGLLFATVGLYGTIAFSVNRRTREIGIRVALGARRAAVLRLVMREGLRLAAAGAAAGLLLAAASTRLLGAYLAGVSPLDAVTFAAMTAALVLVALLATAIPARRAARLEPMTALREE